MNNTFQLAKYLISDWFAAFIAWLLFFSYRKYIIDPQVLSNLSEIFGDGKLYLGILVVPLFWIILYIMAGSYRNVYRKTRIKELAITFSTCFIGVLILYFTLLLDDVVVSHRSHYESFFVLFGLQFVFTAGFRLYITTKTVKKIHRKIIGFNTIIVGGSKNAVDIYKELDHQFPSSGNKFVGFVSVKEAEHYPLAGYLPNLGSYKSLMELIKEHQIEEIIIAVEPHESKLIEKILTVIEETDTIIKLMPVMQDYMLGKVKTTSIFTEPLIQISPTLLPPWQESLKRLIDVVASSMAIILLLPLYIFLIVGVKLSSKGPIFYQQERIGLHGKPFMIPKFRSMYVGAEKGTPQLSSKDDSRITSFGKLMRKMRLDEIPQFFTVLKGDMSLVGYRPERQYYIDQIVERAPHYRMLFKVKPGITSWGQIKFGYASTVDEMIQRLKYDILYVENMSLAMDFKIMFYTVLIIIQGRGK
ncbi:MAG: sugar transferase [Bacteroidales bacterium]|nr:sugar transferase [Bacteroidales bacterium]